MNGVKLAHPSLERLTAFAQGRLPDAELAELAGHLGDCAECRERVEETGDDTLVSLLRAADTRHVREGGRDPRRAVTLAPPAPTPAPPGVPAELADHGRYRVQELLGVGGMGAVYKAEHLLMERPVALKLISPVLMSNPAMVERFRREVKTAARLKHPNIVLAYDAEQAGDAHFLVMEYVEGKSLARLVADQGPLPVRQACEYVRQAALGLQHAHERGMVHRDVKPQNLMRTPEGLVKILDFGLARFVMEAAPAGALLAAPHRATPTSSGRASGDGALTEDGVVMGTPDYIAPEQATDSHTADIRADIYSLGCTLYDLLAGHAPFPEGSALAKVMAHVERSPRPLTEVRGDVPPELARVVERMMAKDPARRYATPAEVATALAPFAAGPRKPWRGWRTLAATAGLAAALLLAGGIIYVQTDQGEFVLETKDEKLAVRVNEKGVRIHDPSSGREYTLKVGRQDVRTGKYQIVVSELPEGIEIEGGTTFTIKRGGRAVATVQLKGKGDREAAAKGDSADAAPGQGRLINAFGTGYQPITRDLVAEEGGWKVVTRGQRVVRLYEVQPPVEECLVTYRARLRCANLEGKAYLEMWCRMPYTGEFFSRGLANPVSGTSDWKSVEIPFVLQKGERPDLLKLNVHVEGAGTVWIKDVALWQAPLPPELMKQPSIFQPTKSSTSSSTSGVVRSFSEPDKPISAKDLKKDQKGWRLDVERGGRFALFEVKDFRSDDCLAVYRARLKSSGLEGKAYLEMLVHLPGDPEDREAFSRGLDMPLTGTCDWASYETPFMLDKGQRPDRVRLNLVVEGKGTVWIKDVELLRGALTK